MTVFKIPKDVTSHAAGISALVELHAATRDLLFDQITLDFSDNTWFDANLFAVVGAILDDAKQSLNTVRMVGLSRPLETLLQRNHFLSHFGGTKLPDFYRSTVVYRKFKTNEEKLFKEYLDTELLSKKAMPNMSAQLRKRINESVFEIFNNAAIHGGCSHIFTCGQYFPNDRRLDFTIVDLGNTIRKNVSTFLDTELSGEQAIKWAVQEGHTTRTGPIPGGLGLSLIREFLKKNKGKIQIASADGFWQEAHGNEQSQVLAESFGGTIVNLEFNIVDRSYYYLSSEVKPHDIF